MIGSLLLAIGIVLIILGLVQSNRSYLITGVVLLVVGLLV